MDILNNLTENLGELGNIAEGLSPVEDIAAQAEELTGGLSDTAGQITDQIGGSIENITG